MNPGNSLPMRCWAEIDLAALERNLKHIRAALPERIRYVAVVKADAYGHGLHPTVARLMHSGADMFAVANIAEAAAVREIGPGWPVLILGPLLPEEMRFVLEYDVIATVSSHEELRLLDDLGRKANATINIHLKIDTGMGRAGVWHESAASLFHHICSAGNVRLRGIFTHFSSADSDAAFTDHQRRLFVELLASFNLPRDHDLLIHADNSAGLESFAPESPFNAVRVGLLQFGILPYEQSLLSRVHPEPVFSFHTRVGLVKTVPAGTGISYGRTCVVDRQTRLAILTAGYGDGIPRICGNRGHALIRGRRCPMLGRVTMDQTIVDVTDVQGVEVGDEVVLVGRQGDARIGIGQFSRWADTVPWETLTSVTKRVPRIYRTGLGL